MEAAPLPGPHASAVGCAAPARVSRRPSARPARAARVGAWCAALVLAQGAPRVGGASSGPVWAYPGPPGVSPPSAFGAPSVDRNSALVFFGSLDASVSCVNASGSLQWRFAMNASVGGAVTLGDYDSLWVGANDGTVCALAKADGSLQWAYRTEGWVWGAPALSLGGGVVFVASTDWTVVALQYQTGALLWRSAPLGGELWGSPAVTQWGIGAAPHGDVVVVGSLDGGVYGLNATDGSAAWPPFFTAGPVTATACLSDSGGVVYVASSDTHLYAIDTLDGKVRRNATTGVALVHTTNGPVTSSPRVNPATGDVVVGSWDGLVYAFPSDPKDGNAGSATAAGAAAAAAGPRTCATGGPVSSSAAFNASTGAILIGSDDGFVHILDALSLLPTQDPLWMGGARVPAPPALGPNGRVYATAGVGALLAWDL